jgi:hypothetical protein
MRIQDLLSKLTSEKDAYRFAVELGLVMSEDNQYPYCNSFLKFEMEKSGMELMDDGDVV